MHKKILGLTVILFAAPALASIPAFSDIDTNLDGSISQAEAVTVGITQRLFAKLDRDKDDKLSADEYNILTKDQS